jgi:predicted dehydrogenase
MNNAKFKGALIGCGFFSHNHMNAWAEIDQSEIVALCDIDETRAQNMAKQYGIKKIYTDAANMLDSEHLDFVDIATTAPSHRKLVELAAAKTKTVICQKPFAETIEDAVAMVDAAEASGANLIIHENFRWQKPFIAIQKFIEEGQIGVPHFARFSFRHGFDNYVNQPYLAEIERFTIMDVGLHLFDLARLFMGEVSHISCTTQRLNPKVRGEDSFTAMLRSQTGMVTICDCSFQSIIHPDPFPRTVAWIEGPEGSIALNSDGDISLHKEDKIEKLNAAPEVPTWGEAPWHFVQDSVTRFQRHVVKVIEGKTDPQPTGQDNVETLALALAAYDAAKNQSTIDMKQWVERSV